MEFSLEMNYDQKSMSAMAKAIRVGLQEDQDRKSRIIGWIFAVMAVVILLSDGKFGWMQIVAAVLIACFVGYLIWQDQVNAFFALQRLPVKMRKGQWLFREDGYFSNTEAGECDFSYENIFAIVQMENYIFLVFHEGRAQILDTNTIQGGTVQDFCRLLRKKTSLTIQQA